MVTVIQLKTHFGYSYDVETLPGPAEVLLLLSFLNSPKFSEFKGDQEKTVMSLKTNSNSEAPNS